MPPRSRAGRAPCAALDGLSGAFRRLTDDARCSATVPLRSGRGHECASGAGALRGPCGRPAGRRGRVRPARGHRRSLLRDVPQRSAAHRRSEPRRPRPLRRRPRRGAVGTGGGEAAHPRHAAGRPPEARRRDLRPGRGVAGIGDRPRRPRRSESGTHAGRASSEPGRVCQRRPRPAGAGRRRRQPAAGRRLRRVRLRQQRRRADGFVVVDGAVPVGRAQDRADRARRDPAGAGHRDLQDPDSAAPGRPDERGPPLRVARGRRHPALLPRRRRVRPADPPAPELRELRARHGVAPRARGSTGWRPRPHVRLRRGGARGRAGSGQLRRQSVRRSRMGRVHALRRRQHAGALPGRVRPARRRGLVRAAVHRAGRGAAAPPERVRGRHQRDAGRQRGGRARRRRGPLRRGRGGGYPEPPRHLRLPARERRPGRRAAVRADDSRLAGPARVPPARRLERPSTP